VELRNRDKVGKWHAQLAWPQLPSNRRMRASAGCTPRQVPPAPVRDLCLSQACGLPWSRHQKSCECPSQPVRASQGRWRSAEMRRRCKFESVFSGYMLRTACNLIKLNGKVRPALLITLRPSPDDEPWAWAGTSICNRSGGVPRGGARSDGRSLLLADRCSAKMKKHESASLQDQP
jgi:hypothetical protein